MRITNSNLILKRKQLALLISELGQDLSRQISVQNAILPIRKEHERLEVFCSTHHVGKGEKEGCDTKDSIPVQTDDPTSSAQQWQEEFEFMSLSLSLSLLMIIRIDPDTIRVH